MGVKAKYMHDLKGPKLSIRASADLMEYSSLTLQQTSCIRVAESSVSASAVKWRGATLTCPITMNNRLDNIL